jgi:hypothetical protein
MAHPFDPGYVAEPFLTLCATYPGGDVYPSDQFRLEWGPIFHRGRLDGSARVLIIGQDPAQHETIVRRILVGEAGRRVQGLLARLGIIRSYVFINAYLYSVYGSVKASTRRSEALIGYRNRWFDALLVGSRVQAVIALGQAADEAWQTWRVANPGQAAGFAYAALTHPTQPESSSKGDRIKLAEATERMLGNWNAALRALSPAIRDPDVNRPLVLFGSAWVEGDRLPIPASDYPAGLPRWMHEGDGWARRAGPDDLAKRRNITITVPADVIP